MLIEIYSKLKLRFLEDVIENLYNKIEKMQIENLGRGDLI
jgi:hypothetical protein